MRGHNSKGMGKFSKIKILKWGVLLDGGGGSEFRKSVKISIKHNSIEDICSKKRESNKKSFYDNPRIRNISQIQNENLCIYCKQTTS